MKIGITGISAFIGYHLAQELLKDDNKVIGFSRHQGELIKEIKSPNFKFEKGEITDFVRLKNVFEDMDLIYHLTAISSERLCKENILRASEINVQGTLCVLELARQKGIKIIYASSGAVYPPSSMPHQEKEADFSGKFYGSSKLIAEKYCWLYNINFACSFVALRFARVYGKGMTRNPIYDILKGIKHSKKIKFYESLNSCYDFVYVKDVVRALIISQNKDWENQIVNISSGKGIVLKNLIKKVEQIIGDKIRVEVIQDRQTIDILDNSKAKKLGWQPRYSLDEGLKKEIKGQKIRM